MNANSIVVEFQPLDLLGTRARRRPSDVESGRSAGLGLRGLAAAAALLVAPAATGQDFDYYLLALSWTPSWCLAEGDHDAEQCDPARDLGFTLHGLWPQYTAGGWPEFCDAAPADDPSRRAGAMRPDRGLPRRAAIA